MPIKKIAHILDLHCVPYFIEDDHIYADSMIAFAAIFEEVEDLTNYTLVQLRSWLGY